MCVCVRVNMRIRKTDLVSRSMFGRKKANVHGMNFVIVHVGRGPGVVNLFVQQKNARGAILMCGWVVGCLCVFFVYLYVGLFVCSFVRSTVLVSMYTTKRARQCNRVESL